MHFYASPIHALPTEILAEIVSYLHTDTRLNLCVSGKVFRDVCIRALYCSVYLSGWRRIVRFCRTVKGNGVARGSVRSVSFDIVQYPGTPLRSFQTLYHTALTLISPRLLNLEIMSPSPILEPSLEHSFPLLKTFTTTLRLTPSILTFLTRHTSITELILFSSLSPPSPPSQTPPLPNLTSFVGLADVAHLLIPGSPVVHVGIAWAHPTQLLRSSNELAKALSGSTKGIVSLVWFSQVFDESLVEALAEHLSGVEYLHFAGLVPIRGGNDEDFYQTLTSNIHIFHSLQLIDVRSRLPSLGGGGSGITSIVLEEEFNTITKWSDRCPSLEVCTMPSRTFWYRLKQSGMWIPVICPDTGLATIWLSKKAKGTNNRRLSSRSSFPPAQSSSNSLQLSLQSSSSSSSLIPSSPTHPSSSSSSSQQRNIPSEEEQRGEQSELQLYLDHIHGNDRAPGGVTSESLGAFFRQSWRQRSGGPVGRKEVFGFGM